MSESASPVAWQCAEVVSAFLDRRQALIPLLDVQEDLIRVLIDRHAHPIERFLDIGCGDGAMSELVLSRRPDSEAVLVDFSEPMLERAGRRLEGRAGRWRAVRSDLSDPGWHAQLAPAGFGAAVSALAIHHLPPERKRSLFAEIFELLEPGGMFVNLDYVCVEGPLHGLFDEQMVANAVRAERERGGDRSAEQVRHDLLDDDGDEDLPDSAEQQVKWLSEAGFRGAEVHFKWAEASVFGAVKPTGGAVDAGD